MSQIIYLCVILCIGAQCVTGSTVRIIDPWIDAITSCKQEGYEWEHRTGKCYKFHRAAKAWPFALSSCLEENGYLAVINSDTESAVLKDIFAENKVDTITGTVFYNHAIIGIRKLKDGVWTTINGELISEVGFQRWADGEPNDHEGPENCGTIDRNGLLNDAPCFAKYPYICEKSP